jgi:hypothetical protein
MNPFVKKLIFIVIAAVLLLILNPDQKKHQDKIIEKYNEANPLTGSLGAGELLRNIVAYKSYYLWSVGKISVTNESISFGIAGFVIVYGDLDIMKYKDKLPNMGN